MKSIDKTKINIDTSCLSNDAQPPKEVIDVCIIGAGLTGLTTAFSLIKKVRSVHIVEQANRVGGQIHTHKVGDFVIESGPNTGSISYPEIVELFQEMGNQNLLETACASAKRRLIWKGDSFVELPTGLISALRTPLFTWYDKFRILGEPFRSKGANPNETVGDLTIRRLGKSYLDYAVDPFISGVYAGNPMNLVTRYALPKLYRLEQRYGSFIRGAIAKAKEPKTSRDHLATKQVFSVRGGLENLVTTLYEAIGAQNITVGAKEVSILPIHNLFKVSYVVGKGELKHIWCKKVVTTCGAYALPRLLPFVEHSLMEQITSLFYAPIVQVGVGLKDTAGLRYHAFGGLVPSVEQQRVLGILFPSACFQARAPQGGAVFSFFLGGVRHQDYINKSKDEITEIVTDALHRMLHFPTTLRPDVVRIFRHRHAIPQYDIKSGLRFAAIEKVQQQYPGLVLAGNMKDGIGMADRIKQAVRLAENL